MRLTIDPKGLKEPALRLSHEQLARILGKMYPGSKHGVDYLVAHAIDPTTGNQASGAQILAWNLPDQMPTIDNEVAAAWEVHGDTVNTEMTADTVRAQRIPLLNQADVLVNIAHDTMDSMALAKAKMYRQALRDITLQPGFPHEVTWPDKPVLAK